MDGEGEDIGMNDSDLKKNNPWAASGWEMNEWSTPWMQFMGPILYVVCAPTFGILHLKARDQQYKTRNFTPFNINFHTLVELHK